VRRSVSILIPTHDRSEILGRSLESLRELRRPSGTELEAVVVANACTDGTEEAVRGKAESFPFPLRLVPEPEPGLNVARNTGARAARGEVLAYLDDDAFVEPGWLAGLLRAFGEYPADLVAGKVVLWWEAIERPAWSSPAVERLLSRLDLGPEVVELPRPGLLMGANFAVRREVLERLGGFVSGLDRAGKDLLSGGDTELAVRAHREGYRLFYAPRMCARHWVAPSRLSRTYLCRLARARGRTRVLLAERLGENDRLDLLRLGCAQVVSGAWNELRARLTQNDREAVAAWLTRMRGLGTLAQLLRRRSAGAPGTAARTGDPADGSPPESRLPS
jgi:GT2 family glycosyltransferase